MPRALALLMVAVRAESLAEGNPIPGAQLRQKFPATIVNLTPKETAFIDQEAPAQTEVVQLAWRYEGAFLLEWALGLTANLPFPERICDVSQTVRALMATSPADLLKRAKLREPTLILDALDLHYRLHWYVRQTRLDGQAPPPGLEGSVIQERHHALNWLVRFEDRDWDNVDTPTQLAKSAGRPLLAAARHKAGYLDCWHRIEAGRSSRSGALLPVGRNNTCPL